MAQESTSDAALDICPRNTVCLFPDNDFTGTGWQWSPQDGYKDMPPYLQDNVCSFVANANCVFINYISEKPPERRTVNNGGYRRAYCGDFDRQFRRFRPHGCTQPPRECG